MERYQTIHLKLRGQQRRKLDSCDGVNVYRHDIADALIPGAERPLHEDDFLDRLPGALAALEATDSDSDLVSNLEELMSGTSPADDCDGTGPPRPGLGAWGLDTISTDRGGYAFFVAGELLGEDVWIDWGCASETDQSIYSEGTLKALDTRLERLGTFSVE